uniref:Uncharacterized protein n=1 Tax=Strongyloides venezuelensis TaxID=75913 RepID=A0A0K0FTU5_STRVS
MNKNLFYFACLQATLGQTKWHKKRNQYELVVKRRSITVQRKLDPIALAKEVVDSEAAKTRRVSESDIRYWRKQGSKILICKKNQQSYTCGKVKWEQI